MTWWEYVQKITRGQSQTEIAKRTGIAQSSVSRWRSIIPTSENVISFAKAYRRPPLEALLAAGVVTDADIQMTQAATTLSQVDTDDLLAEIRRRIPD